jgi:dTMP kinase
MGKFITFEGGEGSGKSTQLLRMANWLTKRGYEVFTTNDPGGPELGMDIRKILLTAKNKKMAHETELLLYLAARAELVHKHILPGLKDYDFVLCDRFHDSTAVYQGEIRGWGGIDVTDDEDLLSFLHRIFSFDCYPDHTFLFDVNPVLGLNRSEGGNKDESKWEEEGIKIHENINNAFYVLAKRSPRFIVIDANDEIDEVTYEMVRMFKQDILLEDGNND